MKTLRELKNSIVRATNNARFKQLVKIANNSQKHLFEISKNPSFLNVTGLGLSVLAGALDQSDRYTESEYNLNEIVFDQIVAGVILDTLNLTPTSQITYSDGTANFFDLDDQITIMWVVNRQTAYMRSSNISNYGRDGIYLISGDLKTAQQFMIKSLWSAMRHGSMMLYHNGDNDNPDHFGVKEDMFETNTFPSNKELVSYFKRSLDANVMRSALFHGAPGTGKSTLVKSIVASLGLRSFRIMCEDIEHLSSYSLRSLTDILKPGAVIIDDIDRVSDQKKLISILETIREVNSVKLVLATANNQNNMTSAVMRPGRFDELFLIEKLDDDIIKSLLGEDNIDVFDKVKDWPIAFITEYIQRRKFMSKDEAISKIVEIDDRVKKLKEKHEIENESMLPRRKHR